MEYFLSIFFNGFKFWEHTLPNGMVLIPEYGTVSFNWILLIVLGFGIRGAVSQNEMRVQFSKKLTKLVMIIMTFYISALIWNPLGDGIPESQRFQFAASGYADLSARLAWGTLCYIIITSVEYFVSRKKTTTT